ncbi:hypothetical protein ON010_g1598 [Phytophthora cinnamomi]|nr:hypothetical protein ON010_g1598 [Phytophthora cinnamomi]
MADIQHKRVAMKLKQACEETAAQAIAATTASGQASRIHGKNRKFGSRKEAMAAKASAASTSIPEYTRLTVLLYYYVIRLRFPTVNADCSGEGQEGSEGSCWREFFCREVLFDRWRWMKAENARRTWPVLRALVAKNWMIKRRHPFATWSEVLNPLLCILLFVALKKFEADLNVPAGWATSDANASAPGYGSTWNLYAMTDFNSALNDGLSSAGIVVPKESTSGGGSNSSSNGTVSASALLGILSSSLKIPRFYFTETTMAGLLLSLSLQALMEGDKLDELGEDALMDCALKFLLFGYTGAERTIYHVPNTCQGKVVPYKIAITPDTPYTREYFAAALETWYPRIALAPVVKGISLLTIPSFADSHVFFDNETALEEYVSSKEYGADVQHPKIYAAIAFDEFPQDTLTFGALGGHSIAYSLRFNSTGNLAPVPNTNKPRPNTITKFAPAGNNMAYATRGFMTLQTVVARFLNCMPTWDAQSSTTNGTCQVSLAVMPANATTDRRLLKQLENDMIIGTAFTLLNSAKDLITSAVSVTIPNVSVDTIPPLGREALLVPLRMAPQPYHGAAVYGNPTQAFRYAPFFEKVALVFPIGFVLSYLYLVSRVIVSFLMEKETKSRELMRILGARDNELFGGWVLAYLPILVLGAFLQTVGAHGMLFPNSDTGLLFVFFFTFATSSFSYGFMISSLFSRARAGSLAGMGLFFMMFFISYSFNDDTSEASRTCAGILPPISLSEGIGVIAKLESFGVGVTGDNANDEVNNFRFANAIGMQILDTVVYILLGKYFEKVVPQEFGVAEKWYFLLSKAYWCPHASQLVSAEAEGEVDKVNDTVEPIRLDLKQQESSGRAVVIKGLRKEFSVPGGKKIAVHGLDLKLYEGQITCLLGHNGAGKTTVMSMLTGMTPPSSGSAWIRGHSVVSDMRKIRQSLGYCPQHSVLYPDLTVKEHLTFYGRLKGFTNASDLAAEVIKKINEVGLSDKIHVRSHALSGGMQRKLSLAIAFLGNSTVVFLDEPTAGMDPYSRRSTWELIQRNRAGRVVILTTHFMDEADILGDRIAIMAEGRLQCVGSSLFLKKRFGVGYRLSFVRQSEANTALHARSARLLVQQHVPQAIVASDVGTELSFQLPFEASAGFPALFCDLESRQHELGILSFSISVTTLEEIFLKVAESGSTEMLPSEVLRDEKTTTSLAPDKLPNVETWETAVVVRSPTNNMKVAGGSAKSPPLRVIETFANQMTALLRKRVQCGKRDLNMLFFSTVLPVAAIFVGLSALKYSAVLVNDPKLELSSTVQYSLAQRTPVPFGCPRNLNTNSGSSGWYSELILPAYFSDGAAYEVEMNETVYDGFATPTVFGVSYDSPSIEPNDTSGYGLRFAELVFEKGYGYASDDELPAQPTQFAVEGQFGGFLLYASEDTKTMGYNVLANGSSTHAAPTYKHMIDSAINRFLLSKAGKSSSNVTLRVFSHPLPLSFKTRSIFSAYLSFPAVVFIVIAFTFIPASMMPYIVKEKDLEQNAKYQQILSGMSFFAYWLANFCFDVAVYLIPMTAAILLLGSYGVTSSLGGAESCASCTQDVPVATATLFVLFGTAIAPWTYLLSHVMEKPSECLLYTVMINFFLGLLLLLLSFTMNSLDSTRAANDVLVYIWRCSPLFALGNGLLNILLADLLATYGLTSQTRSAFDADIAGTDVWYLLIECPVFILLTIGVDVVQAGTVGWRMSRFVDKINSARRIYTRVPCNSAKLHIQLSSDAKGIDSDDVDEDVVMEAQRVHESFHALDANSEVVQVFELEKVYPNGKRAVKKLSFGLQQGECFGFLGVNGAGKTTTMKVLTGDLLPTSGTATLNGFDIRKERSQARESIGYCPQFDALIDLLTVREHLELFGRFKGFHHERLQKEVDRLMNKLKIQAFANKLAGSLSGGNKRKLSLAIAMIGEPSVLVLDEPSTGVDPFSRRLLWDVILEASVQTRRSTVMLTTHSMEECEALCSKAGIMVNGGLRCFGSIPHLKARFGDGFMLECKMEAPPLHAVADLTHLVCDHLQNPGAEETGAQITAAQLAGACAVLGNAKRADNVAVALSTQLGDRDNGSIDVVSFASWWLLEDAVQHLDEFLRAHFSGVTLLERQADFCRYKVSDISPETKTEAESDTAPQVATALSRMFGLVEDARGRLGIKEYSLSQTSLEQIFNSFARQRNGADSRNTDNGGANSTQTYGGDLRTRVRSATARPPNSSAPRRYDRGVLCTATLGFSSSRSATQRSNSKSLMLTVCSLFAASLTDLRSSSSRASGTTQPLPPPTRLVQDGSRGLALRRCRRGRAGVLDRRAGPEALRRQLRPAPGPGREAHGRLPDHRAGAAGARALHGPERRPRHEGRRVRRPGQGRLPPEPGPVRGGHSAGPGAGGHVPAPQPAGERDVHEARAAVGAAGVPQDRGGGCGGAEALGPQRERRVHLGQRAGPGAGGRRCRRHEARVHGGAICGRLARRADQAERVHRGGELPRHVLLRVSLAGQVLGPRALAVWTRPDGHSDCAAVARRGHGCELRHSADGSDDDHAGGRTVLGACYRRRQYVHFNQRRNTRDRAEDELLMLKQVLGETMVNVGPSIVVAAVAETLAFLVGALTRIPALTSFCVVAALAVAANFALQMTWFASALVLDARRVRARRYDLFPWVKQKLTLTPPTKGKRRFESKVHYQYDLLVDENDPVDESPVRTTNTGSIQRFVEKTYIPFLLRRSTKVLVLVTALSVITLSAFGSSELPLGLEQELAVPTDFYLHEYFKKQTALGEAGPPAYVVLDSNVDYTDAQLQQDVNVLLDQLSGLRQYIQLPVYSWLHTFNQWRQMRFFLEDKIKQGQCDCPVQPMDPFPYELANIGVDKPREDVFLAAPEYGYGARSIANVTPNALFYPLVKNFTQISIDSSCCQHFGLCGAQYEGDIIFNEPKPSDDTASMSIVGSRMRFQLNALRNQSMFVNSYYYLHDVVGRWSVDHSATAFPYALVFVYEEQYTYIQGVALQSVLLALAVVFGALFVLMDGSLRLTTVVTLCVLSMAFSQLGFLFVWNVIAGPGAETSINAVSAVNLLACVGLGVEFCVHTAHQFAFSRRHHLGTTANDHTRYALTSVGASIFSGITLTKFCGIGVLAFAPSMLFRVYFFRMYLGIVVLGCFHGLVLLPVLLSLIGQPQKYPNDLSSFLLSEERDDEFEDEVSVFNNLVNVRRGYRAQFTFGRSFGYRQGNVIGDRKDYKRQHEELWTHVRREI